MVKKCIWTGKSSEDLIEFQFQDVNGVMIYSVDAKHLEEFKTFLRFYLKYKNIFLFLVLSIPFIIILGEVFKILYITKIALITLGLTTFVFPFSTPETINFLGVKKSILLVRLISVVIMFLPFILKFN